MNVAVRIGAQRSFRCERAILVYSEAGGSDTFATVHEVIRTSRAARLGEASPLTLDFLTKLAEGLGTHLAPEVLPENVVAYTPRMVSWWTAPHWRPLFFRKESELGHLNGRHFPIPPLLWKLVGAALFVRALAEPVRPSAETPLFVAPFWNTNEQALVCQGTMKRPGSSRLESLKDWVDGYFGAEFTHGWGNRRLTTVKGGYRQLLEDLAGDRTSEGPFPAGALTPAKENVVEFLHRASAHA